MPAQSGAYVSGQELALKKRSHFLESSKLSSGFLIKYKLSVLIETKQQNKLAQESNLYAGGH